MADIQLDVASANRFISSLSKSLQALCHGCMDFDAGIEIVGYINVNIDSGSKVDYVLNEKVLKSTTNSMTFVSNSFLAKKDQPKACKDGSCSPIPELNYPQQRTQGNYSYPATQLYRSSGIYSPHSQVLRGSQKRQWAGGDWRASPRKFSRGAKAHHGSYQQQQSLSSSQSESYSQYSNQQIPNSSATQQSSESQEYDNSGGGEGDVNIKKEVEDSTGETAADGESTDQNISAGAENINIKADPDAEANQDSSENFPSKSETNISDSFLQQPNKTDVSDDPSNVDTNQDNIESNYQDPSYDESYGESNAGEGGDNSNSGADSQRQSGADANYDESGEMFSESYSGEGTSGGGGGQFEVIEIDDEDEDVAAMFDESRSPSAVRGARSWSHSNIHQNSFMPPTESGKCNYLHMEVEGGAKIPYCYMYTDNQEFVYCFECGRSYRSSSGVKAHFKIKHCGTFDHHCDICGKGFQQLSHLKCHMVLHSGEKQFACGLCGSKYAHKTSLTAHMKLSHNGAVIAPEIYGRHFSAYK